MDNKQLIGQNIRNYRTLRGMSQYQLAYAIGCAQSTIAMYESGRREPDMDTIEAIADVFNISKRDLVPDDRHPDLFAGLESVSIPVHLTVGNSEDTTIFDMVSGMSRLSKEEQKKLLDMASIMFPGAFDKQ